MEPIESRRLEEKERRREDILDAAEAVFAAKGFDDAKMDDIARAARVSRALLYIYFKDKRELQFALCLRGMDLLRQRFAEARAAAMPEGLTRSRRSAAPTSVSCRNSPSISMPWHAPKPSTPNWRTPTASATG